MPITRTPEALAALEQQIIQSHGDLGLACRALQCSPLDINQWVMADPEVAERIHQARLLGWTTLESEAIRRATGYEEEVWYQGEMVGTTTKYSDGLLQTLLKARVPGHQADASAHRPMVQINVMPRASNYQEWQEQRQMALKGPVEYADYAEVEPISDAAKAAYEIMKAPQDTVMETYPGNPNGLPDWF